MITGITAGATPFSPLGLPGIEALFDVSNPVARTIASGKYTALADITGHGHNMAQASPALQYTHSPASVNGKDAATSAGTGTMTTASSIVFPNSSFWAYAVFGHINENLILTLTSSTSSYGLDSAPGGIMFGWADGTGQVRQMSGLGAATSNGSINLMIVNCDATSCDLYFNNTMVSLPTLNGFPCNSLHGYGGFPLNGTFCESGSGVIGKLSALNITRIQSYSRSKWGTP